MEKCKNCDKLLSGKYCSNCGQKNYSEKDKSLKNLIEETFHFLTHYESNFLTTIRTILTQPGKLSLDYSNGVRKKYFKPVSLFLLIVVLYIILPVLNGLKLDLKSYQKENIYGKFVKEMIVNKMKQENVSENRIIELFDEKSKTVSKIALLILIPFSAAFIFILYPRHQHLVFDNLIVSTEINSFYLLYLIIFSLFTYFVNKQFSLFLSSIFEGGFVIFTTSVFKKNYSQKLYASIIKAAFFVSLHLLLIIFIYRPLVFFISFIMI